MRQSLLWLLALSMIAAPAVAQDNMTDDGMMSENQMSDDSDDEFAFMPFVILAAFAAVAFLLAKYGP